MAWDEYVNFDDERRVAVAYWLDEFEIVRSTEKALLVRDATGGQEWLPKSQCHFEFRDGVKCLYVEEWIAKQKSLDFHTQEFD